MLQSLTEVMILFRNKESLHRGSGLVGGIRFDRCSSGEIVRVFEIGGKKSPACLISGAQRRLCKWEYPMACSRI